MQNPEALLQACITEPGIFVYYIGIELETSGQLVYEADTSGFFVAPGMYNRKLTGQLVSSKPFFFPDSLEKVKGLVIRSAELSAERDNRGYLIHRCKFQAYLTKSEFASNLIKAFE